MSGVGSGGLPENGHEYSREVKAMELVRWRPRRNLPVGQDEIDRAFDRLLGNWWTPATFSEFDWNPSVDVAETESEIIVKADVPGVSKDDIDITVDNNQLIISGEKTQETEEKEKNYYHMERRYGSFRRVFGLPSTADTDNIKAGYDKGVLTVTIPKAEVAKGRKVEIEGE
jgi:HSP20 family protein